VIELKDISKSFRLYTQNSAKITVFKDVNLTVNRGELVAFTGKSGSGKTTLMKMIYGNYLPSKGSILVDKTDITKINLQDLIRIRNHKMGYISQFLRVIPRVSTMNIVSDSLIKLGSEKEDALAQASELLNFLDIPRKLWNLSPLTFSGGEQQRINIARAMICNYPYFLLDEPTASLDNKNIEKVITLIDKLKKNGCTIIGIFHDEMIRNEIADREIDVNSFK
jgi:alpha-D-ribose 1-methylphosphonate 5-triphosphate synthase subunit PhnL|tara:strand:+ start:1334 stop:2002 length:669 start_codon:yes stop_codon:yes gene_type:complete